MKQIFDWLREAICEGSQCINERYYTTVVHSLSCVNEAEAKWKSEVCEWKVLHEKCFIQNPHTKRLFSNEESMQNVYCNTCGKPIKISEVE